MVLSQRLLKILGNPKTNRNGALDATVSPIELSDVLDEDGEPILASHHYY